MTTMGPEIERELHELRRRAYGPHAETGLEADEAARLEELESHARALRTANTEARRTAPIDETAAAVSTPGAHGADAPTQPASARTASAGAAASREAATGPDAEEQASAASAATPATARPRRLWWRNRLLWAGAAAGAVLGALIATAVSVDFATPPPDGTLRVVAGDADAADQSGIALYVGVDPDTLVQFDDWKTFEVRTGRKADGEQCLFVNADQGVFDFACGFGGLDPQVDIWVFGGMSSLIGETVPTGSMIRFVARGDTVDVWEQLSETVSAE